MKTREQYILGILLKKNPVGAELIADTEYQYPNADGTANERARDALRNLIKSNCVVTEPDGTIWATPRGWALATQGQHSRDRVTAKAQGQRRGR